MSKGTIFIVDDNANNLNLLDTILRSAGYQVRATNSARRVIKMLELNPPDLVMLDIQMPEMDGYEVCAAMKNIEAIRPIPVIFISALDQVLDKVRAFQVGGVDYVTKPFQPEEVLLRIETHLEIFRLRRDLERQNAELKKKNEELVAAHKKTDRVFSALSDVLPGTVLDDSYKIIAKIGEGGFGAVFRADHLSVNRPVAIKILRPTDGTVTEEGIARFRLEGIASCRLNHPNAVEVLDFCVSSLGVPYLVMELLRGYTLGWVLAEHSVLPVTRCAEIILPICDVLADAHSAGIIHRDIKPENIFLHQTKRGEIVKVVDFGIAKIMDEEPDERLKDLTITGMFVGTPDYMAPERIMADMYDGRSDVYSVGVLLYRMLSGKLPFPVEPRRNPHAVAIQHLTTKAIPLRDAAPSIPVDIERVVESALEKDPSARPTAAELRDRLAHVLV